MPAVPSGRRVTLRSPLSVKVYISFCTTSVVSPTERSNNSVCSKVGMRISRKPYRRAVDSRVDSRCCHLGVSAGRMSLVPRGAVVRYAMAGGPS